MCSHLTPKRASQLHWQYTPLLLLPPISQIPIQVVSSIFPVIPQIWDLSIIHVFPTFALKPWSSFLIFVCHSLSPSWGTSKTTSFCCLLLPLAPRNQSSSWHCTFSSALKQRHPGRTAPASWRDLDCYAFFFSWVFSYFWLCRVFWEKSLHTHGKDMAFLSHESRSSSVNTTGPPVPHYSYPWVGLLSQSDSPASIHHAG